MAANIEHDKGKTGGAPALPGVPLAIRSEWQNVEDEDADLNDISAIINGNKAVTGKAVYSANQSGRNADQIEAQKADQKKRDADIQEARELTNLAEWNGQMTNVGGVEMTNEQAQKGRQHIIDNEDYYAHRAVKEGRIRASEEDEYKATNRRIKYLKDLEGRGIATEEQLLECKRLEKSRTGEAANQDIGQYATQEINKEQNAVVKKKNADAVISTSFASINDDPFQSAPKLTQVFADANSATNDSTPKPDNTIPTLAVRDLKSTGLAI